MVRVCERLTEVRLAWSVAWFVRRTLLEIPPPLPVSYEGASGMVRSSDLKAWLAAESRLACTLTYKALKRGEGD